MESGGHAWAKPRVRLQSRRTALRASSEGTAEAELPPGLRPAPYLTAAPCRPRVAKPRAPTAHLPPKVLTELWCRACLPPRSANRETPSENTTPTRLLTRTLAPVAHQTRRSGGLARGRLFSLSSCDSFDGDFATAVATKELCPMHAGFCLQDNRGNRLTTRLKLFEPNEAVVFAEGRRKESFNALFTEGSRAVTKPACI